LGGRVLHINLLASPPWFGHPHRIQHNLADELGLLLKTSPSKFMVTVQLVSAQENMALEAASKGFSRAPQRT